MRCASRLWKNGVDVKFTDDAHDAIVAHVVRTKFGLRSLESLFSLLTLRLAFDAGFATTTDPLVVDAHYIESIL